MALSPSEIDRRIAAASAPMPGPGTVAAQRRSNRATRKWARSSGIKPRSRVELAHTPLPASARSVSAALGAAHTEIARGGLRAAPGAGTPLKRPLRSRSGVPVLGEAVGIARAVGHAAGAVAETTAENPGRAGGKALTQAGDIVKGLAGAAIGLPVYAATYPVKSALGVDAGDSPITIGKNMVDAEVKRISDTYGPSYRGDKKSYAKLKKHVREEGPLMPALDVATALAPTSVALGAAGRAGALGRTAKAASASRPALRKAAFGEAEKQAPRKSAAGMATATSHDAARKVAQRIAKARAEKRLRVRAVERVTRKPVAEGSLLHADPKPLAPHRATLKSGEVAPLTRARTRRSVNLDVATEVRRGKDRASLRVAQHVTGRKGDTLRASMKQVPEELHSVVWWARTHGVRDAAGAREMVALRRAEIERSQANALAGAGKQGKQDRKAAVRAEKTGSGELELLRRIEADPKIVERPEVKAAIEREVARGRAVVGPREGLGEARAATGRAKLGGTTLGVKRADEINAERAAARDAGKADAKQAVKAAEGKRERVRTTGARVLAGARADLAKARGRAEILSRNVTGTQQRGATFAGGAHGVREAERALDAAKARVAEELSAATVAVVAAREAHKAASAPIKRLHETPQAYEARVAAAAAERGLAAPEHARSTFATDPDDLRIRRGITATGAAPKNPLGKERKGTLRRLGQEDLSTKAVEDTYKANLRRGARMDAEARVLEKHGLYFRSPEEANRFAAGLGIDPQQLDLIRPSTGMVRKGTPGASPRPRDDAGDFAKMNPHGVFMVPKHVADQLDALDARPSTTANVLRKLGQLPQGAILALSPSWFGFQRVNDLIASTMGGSTLTQAAFQKVRRELDPDSAEIVTVLSGRGGLAQEFLSPTSGQKLGRMARILDENPTYRDALKSAKPATNLIVKGMHDVPTALLRADAKITGGVRERQLMHNLLRAGARMDPDVRRVAKGLGPFGHALKTGDVALMEKLLKDPKFHAARDEAVEALIRVHGDWHNYTAAEQRFKSAFAFYGFLRYSTRMALYTLPVNHPHVGLLLSQLGSAGSEYAKSVIGPDMPYRLGAVYNKDGTIAADFTRANPLTGPLFSVTKPEQAAGLLAPPVTVALSYLLGQPVGLSDSSTGYVAQFTVRGDPQDHAVGGFGGDARLRIAARNTLSWLYPFRAWQDADTRPQSHDSLPFSRRPLRGATGAEQLKIDEKHGATPSGAGEIAHELFPFLGVGSGENVKLKGQRITEAKAKREAAEELRKAKRAGAKTPLGRAKLSAETLDAKVAASTAAIDARVAEIDRRVQLKLARAGLGD